MPRAWKSSSVLRAVFGNPDLRRIELGFAGFNAAEWAAWIAMLVFAYEQGGATEAGIVALAQLVPAGIVAPFGAILADRYRPVRVLELGYLAQALALAGTAGALLAEAPPPLAYTLAALAATAVTLTRPTQAALTPTLARSPDELTATNVVSGWIESTSILAAPAATGALLTAGSPGTVFVAAAVVVLAAAVTVRPVKGPPAAGATAGGPLRNVAAGFRVLAREPAPRTIVALLGLQYVVIGAADVLYVVLAIGVFHLGESWAGYLNAAFGLGGVVGLAATVTLVGRPRLTRPLVTGAAAWAAAFAALAVWPTRAGALLLLAAAGTGRSLLDAAGRTLLQRSAQPAALGRVFGVLESVSMAGLALGSLLVPALVALGGARTALAVLAALLTLGIAFAWRRLRDVDAAADVPVVEIGLLRSLPLFSSLGAPELERLARQLSPLSVAPGAAVIRQDERGDRFYVVADGELAVLRDGTAIEELRRGDSFGEIALLRAVPRTATVQARTPARLYTLEREAFLDCLAAHPASRREAETVVQQRLGTPSAPQGKIVP